jgi:hypothetical protein
MVSSLAIYEIFVVSLVSVILEVGLTIYLYKIFRICKGGFLERGMLIVAISPVLMILSSIFDALSELDYGAIFDAAHDLFRIAFFLLLFLGFRAIVIDWKKLTK